MKNSPPSRAAIWRAPSEAGQRSRCSASHRLNFSTSSRTLPKKLSRIRQKRSCSHKRSPRSPGRKLTLLVAVDPKMAGSAIPPDLQGLRVVQVVWLNTRISTLQARPGYQFPPANIDPCVRAADGLLLGFTLQRV